MPMPSSMPPASAQVLPRRRDALLVRGWRARLTHVLCVALFVNFIGGPAAVLRACTIEDDYETCEADFSDDDTMGEPSGTGGIPGSSDTSGDTGTSDALNNLTDPGTTAPTGSGTEPVTTPTDEPPPSVPPTAEPPETSEPPAVSPEPTPETPPVEPVPEETMPDPSTETPPDETPPAEPVEETPPDSAPVEEPAPPEPEAPPVDDYGWTDESLANLLSLPTDHLLTLKDAPGTWDGVNKFRVQDGNARRAIPELRLGAPLASSAFPGRVITTPSSARAAGSSAPPATGATRGNTT